MKEFRIPVNAVIIISMICYLGVLYLYIQHEQTVTHNMEINLMKTYFINGCVNNGGQIDDCRKSAQEYVDNIKF